MAERMLLTQTDAAKVLGVGVQAVRAAIEAGKIRTVVLGRRRLVPRSALEELAN